jgi:hypothetical protein
MHLINKNTVGILALLKITLSSYTHQCIGYSTSNELGRKLTNGYERMCSDYAILRHRGSYYGFRYLNMSNMFHLPEGEQTALKIACYFGLTAAVQLLAERRSDVAIDSKDRDGLAPLSWAALMGYEDVVNLLLETGKVDVNSTDNNGRTRYYGPL